MGRRTNEQICIDLRKERSQLYSKRNRVLKKLQNKKLRGQKRKEADREWQSLQNRLEAIKVQLFRCGKKYASFKKQRTKLKRHQRYLSKKVAQGTLNKKELKLAYEEMRRTIKTINEVETAMLLPVGKMKRGVTGFIQATGGKFKTTEVLWALSEMFKNWVNSGEFSILVLDDEIIDIASNPIVGQIKVDQAIQQAMAWQDINPSPYFYAYGDIPNGYIEIMVMNYQQDMFEGESYI